MSDLNYKKINHVAWISINRPARGNTISAEAVDLFLEYMDRAESDDQVRVVCLTAEGDRIFCSGADLGSAMQAGKEEKQKIFNAYAGLLARISQFPKPTLAKINGHCQAGGTGFMLACDIVVAREDVRFGTPEVNVGLFPMMIGALIFRNVLRKKAMEMILLGEKITAAKALEMGMVTRVYPGQIFDGETRKILDALAAKSPIGMRLGKEAFNACEGMPLVPALTRLARGLEDISVTKDALEGINAFMEKRTPVFTGE